MNKKGLALILGFVLVVVITLLGSAMVSRAVSEARIAQRYLETTQAFWLAEAAVNSALDSLRSNYAATAVNFTTLGSGSYGGYLADIAHNPDGSRTISAYGCVPAVNCRDNPGQARAIRLLQAMADNSSGEPPANFFNNVIYAVNGITVSGTSNSLRGNVTYNGTLTGTLNIEPGTGTLAQDTSLTCLPALDYAQLRQLSQGQGNYYDIGQLSGPFPTSFWYDEAQGIPNIVFLEGNLDLSGKTLVGGFFVVGGEVSYDATLSGNVAVDGCIYTRGNFTINGGGKALNINGGVWVGGLTTLNGGVELDYNPDYMSKISDLDINTVVRITGWQDSQPIYEISP